jgi:hypothetical protein
MRMGLIPKSEARFWDYSRAVTVSIREICAKNVFLSSEIGLLISEASVPKRF